MSRTNNKSPGPMYPFVVTPSMDEEGVLIIVVPDLPGCMTHVEAGEDIVTAAQDAIDTWIEFAQEEGETVPAPGSNPQAFPDWARDAVFPTLSTNDVARILDVSPRRVRTLAKDRGVGRMIGNSLMFYRTDIEQMRPGPVGRPALSR